MEVVVSDSKPSSVVNIPKENLERDRVRVKRKTLQSVLEEFQRALEYLGTTSGTEDDYDGQATAPDEERGSEGSSSLPCDREADELCDLLKSRVGCPEFLEKLECAQASVPQNMADEGNSWDVVSENDLWEGENIDSDQDDYFLVREEDIVDGIASFMAAYLLSLKQTKDLTPNQLQEALSKTFSVKKKNGKLRKAWAGSKVIYNVASWGATAIGIYQNPVILRAATKAFWTSCQVISKLL
ncbi:putative MADS box interactor-like protein [Quillaja saponaria]|uniref:MADS box interactor-like protein n=1 Tax=Quillaja saponaria TaxID=32244 RepID=A0AAD7LKE9_QUISA|nr:putative MADS box interactor-like protein [Quillaja saponaria]